MDTLYELCESWFYERIGVELSREKRDEKKGNIYDDG
jgi:hypothetical protein